MDAMKSVVLLSLLLVLSLAIHRHKKCPKKCRCEIYDGKKKVVCDQGNMYKIPTPLMDKDIEILIITAPAGFPNMLTIGRIFMDFEYLEEIHITHSHVPAIGDSSFWPGKRLRLLNLSHNNISILRDSDFNGLNNLQILNLSDNNIQVSEIPSALFRHLTNLTTLLLARNKLHSLVPRFFYLLSNLKYLDLSGNPLTDLDVDIMKDIGHLTILKLANCQLSKLHSMFYQQVPKLQELDLRSNLMTSISPEEFRHVRNLRILYLQRNVLKSLKEKTFDKHSFDYLDLSGNQIESISSCAFCNASVYHLDLSSNHLTSLHPHTLVPFSNSLQYLDLSYNHVPIEDLSLALRPLLKLRKLYLMGMQLNELTSDAFINLEQLEILNLSHNNIFNITPSTFEPLKKLEALDLSRNEFQQLSSSALNMFDNLTSLNELLLFSNPWSCDTCEVIYFINWMNSSSLYNVSCQATAGDQNCLRCVYPSHLIGKEIHRLKPEELDVCEVEPLVANEMRDLSSTSKIGLIIAVTIIVILVLTIIVIIIIYKRHGAVYYTREDDRGRNSIYDNPSIGGTNGLSDEKKSTYVSTLGRIEEGKESIPSPITSVG
ncbi:carboxypeptidase N subunit 2-like [Centruroides vittatus]|uniref:carboxypeptidase N subunit 2-like n=1 Tax=Centruroides vittatus TaxID=120091 RepID=UPI00350EDD8D